MKCGSLLVNESKIVYQDSGGNNHPLYSDVQVFLRYVFSSISLTFFQVDIKICKKVKNDHLYFKVYKVTADEENVYCNVYYGIDPKYFFIPFNFSVIQPEKIWSLTFCKEIFDKIFPKNCDYFFVQLKMIDTCIKKGV
jgi:hypothetical protein